MPRWLWWSFGGLGGVAALALIYLGLFGLPRWAYGRDSKRIYAADPRGNGRDLQLMIAGIELRESDRATVTEPRVTVREAATTVRLEATQEYVSEGAGQNFCVTVRLRSPLGGRRVVDELDDAEVPTFRKHRAGNEDPVFERAPCPR